MAGQCGEDSEGISGEAACTLIFEEQLSSVDMGSKEKAVGPL